MKLIKLKIENIASIETAEIDFDCEPLAGSSVFLITGDTGPVNLLFSILYVLLYIILLRD